MLNSINATSMPRTSQTNRNMLGGMQLPTIPNHVITSGQSNLNDEQFKAKIEELAKREFAAGRNPRFTAGTGERNEWRQLWDDFVSVASPDRTGIINNTLSGLANKLSQMMPRVNLRLDLLTLLMGNSRLFNSKDIGGNFMNFRDASGNLIAGISNGDWHINTTPAEEERLQKFLNLWDETFQRVGEEFHRSKWVIDQKVSGNAVDLAERIGRGQTFNMEKLAAAGITLDPETGRTVVNMGARGGVSHINVQNGQEMSQSHVQEQMIKRYEESSSFQ